MLLPFSDTTVKNGILQGIERWTGLGDTGITGDTTQLKIFTAEVNESFDELMPDILHYLRAVGWDDSNQSGVPIKKQNISTATNKYTFTTDDNSANIISISNVLIFQNSTTADYVEIPQITADDPLAPFYLTPNASRTGVPSSCLILGLTVYFDVIPNYNSTNGLKAVISREQYQFLSTDTTKKAALPSPFHPLLVYLTAQRWLSRNKTLNPDLQALIVQGKAGLKAFIGALETRHQAMVMGGREDVPQISFR